MRVADGSSLVRPMSRARRWALALGCALVAAGGCTETVGPRERTGRILFVRSADAAGATISSADIWRMKADGTELENLTRYPTGYGDLQSTPDGVVVFAAARDHPGASSADCGRRIWRMATDGSQLRPITSGPECSAHPRLSPDGTRIAYVRGSHVFVAGLDGSGEVRLTGSLPPVPAGPCGATPKVTVMVTGWYAPDRVSFWRHVCLVGQTDYTVGADGTDLREVPLSEPAVVQVSPDLSRVSFTRDGQLWVRNLDGTGLRALAAVGTGMSEASPWSPDGTRLVFTDAAGRFASIGIDGSGLRTMVTPPRTAFGGWSRDGAQLAWSVYGATRIDIHVSGADGAGLVPLATGETSNRYATWVETR
ncbi:MAG: Protein TolB [Gemmatimonadetes bacterium]|nr:Protein TolB [Gemmatimonadota bacterium]